MELRLPNITAPDSAGQIAQMKSYMYQLASELNLAIAALEGEAERTKSVKSISGASAEKEARDTFNSIKALIIKSADIVESYYEQLNTRLEGQYVARSEFGEFAETTSNEISASSSAIEQYYENQQSIKADISALESELVNVTANIRTGLLYYDESGAPVYGVEVGQRTEVDGEPVFNKYARFAADRLSFYDMNDTEVAYISDYRLYITNAQIKGSVTIGRYILDTTSGLAFRWV